MIETTIGALTVGDLFSFNNDEICLFRVTDVEELTEDIVIVSCKGITNAYKYDRYKTFKGKLLKSLKVYVTE